MSNVTNDQKILELKKQIEIKKEKLINSQKFSPVTNCSIEFDGIRYNIHTLSRNDLIALMVRLNTHLISAKDLELEDEYIVSGYKLSDWIDDIKSKLDVVSRKNEERKLKAMEDKLHKLLSEDKKVELELDVIESMLKGN